MVPKRTHFTPTGSQSPSLLQEFPPSAILQPPRSKQVPQSHKTSATIGTEVSVATTATGAATAESRGGGVVLLPSPNDASTHHYQTMDKLYGSAYDELEVSDSSTVHQCALSWQNLSFSVRRSHQRAGLCRRQTHEEGGDGFETTTRTLKLGDDQHCILKSISGRSAPGDLTAIIGPSGAGKTTLLDMLADRLSSSDGLVRGVVEVNGRARDPKTFRSVMNYVSQDVAFLGSFTVLETLQMAAGLSLPAHTPQLTREMRVHDVIDAMGLRNCARTRVGDVFHKGISNGQRKRLGIAIELLSNPSILLLDEPTSGLDSSSARRVMEHIVQLCKEGKNVVCTIHQPSSAIYEMLTNLVILSMGEQVYYGPTSNALTHFFALGHICPMYSNPTEFFVHLVNKDFHDQLSIMPFVTAWLESAEANTLRLDIARDHTKFSAFDDQVLQALAPSSWNQFTVLLQRNWVNNWRNPGVFWIRVLMYLLLSLMVGTMYLSSNEGLTIEAMVPLLFYVQAFLVFMSVAAIPALIEQRAVFQREVLSNSLNLLSYVSANLLASLPGIAFISLLATAIVVYFAQVHTFSSFFLNLTLSLVVSESLMHVLGAAVPHYIIGIALGAGLFGMFMLCEGFMVPAHSIPDYWLWGYYIAFHTYSFESFMYEHFSHVGTPEAWDVLKQYGMQNVNVTRNMLILAGYAIALQVVFVVILYFFRGGRRK
ncbi:hypothetical protein Gpo141_00012432 [Globisporangium polare]